MIMLWKLCSCLSFRKCGCYYFSCKVKCGSFAVDECMYCVCIIALSLVSSSIGIKMKIVDKTKSGRVKASELEVRMIIHPQIVRFSYILNWYER